MPTYIRPKRAIIEPDGGRELLTLAVLVAVVLVAVGAVVSWAAAHAVLLACCLTVFAVVLGSFCIWSRWACSPNRRAALRQAEERRQLLKTLPPAREIPADHLPVPKRARWPHSVSPGDVAAVFHQSGSGESP